MTFLRKMISRAHMVCTHTQHTSKMHRFSTFTSLSASHFEPRAFFIANTVAHGYIVWEGTNIPRWHPHHQHPTISRTDLACRPTPRGAGLQAPGWTDPMAPLLRREPLNSPLEPTCTCGYLLFNLCKIPRSFTTLLSEGETVCVSARVCVCDSCRQSVYVGQLSDWLRLGCLNLVSRLKRLMLAALDGQWSRAHL